MSSGSITRLLTRFHEGDPHVAGHLWHRYFDDVIVLVHGKLREPLQFEDDEDVAMEVFQRLLEAAKKKHLEQFSNRRVFWFFLSMMTHQTVYDRLRYHKRAKRRRKIISVDVNSLLGHDTRSEAIMEMHDLLQEVLSRPLCEMVRMRLNGFTNAEIADWMDITERSVERKFQRIREELIGALQDA